MSGYRMRGRIGGLHITPLPPGENQPGDNHDQHDLQQQLTRAAIPVFGYKHGAKNGGLAEVTSTIRSMVATDSATFLLLLASAFTDSGCTFLLPSR